MASREDRKKLRITRENYYDYFLKDSIKFPAIIGANTEILAPHRTMKSPYTYSTIRFLYLSDIVAVMDTRIKKHEQNPRMKKHVDKWHNLRGQAYALQLSNWFRFINI